MKDVLKIAGFIFLLIIVTQVKAQNLSDKVIPGAERVIMYKPVIKNKVIAVVANHTSMVGNRHLVDTLVSLGANIKKIFCPEHGFRGNEDAGKLIKNGRDAKTGIPIVSLYGKKVKPTAADLAGIDVVIYDLQDVGVRFYTYISTLTYMMDACAESFKLLMVLDRPNPNGFYVDGPVLDLKYKSFVGVLPIPVVYGMTPGELAGMINKEGWLSKGAECSLGVIKCENYTHKTLYRLPVNPSPNLQNMKAVYLYPSLALFEGTAINVGRGTDFPFQVFGHPRLTEASFQYKPRSIAGVSVSPPHLGETCNGVDLRGLSEEELVAAPGLNLEYLISAYQKFPDKATFFNSFFENLAGTGQLRKQIISGANAAEIKASWQSELQKFKEARKKYLLYADF
ncbi:MAG: DUF1343 domain-containing protein [Bacteroidota bacterium]|nr:DUF1343 domain-containing protein [Bacteroidota bacterium]